MFNEKIERLTEWTRRGKALPYSIELSPTLRCNLNCLFCWRYGKKVDYGNELILEEYKKILEEANQLKVKEIRIIGGGEPLFRKDTLEVMKEVKKYGMFGYICTNGTPFSDDKIKTLVAIGWDHIKISLHGSNKKTQDYLAQEESFEKVIKNIKSFVRWKIKLKTKKPKLEIGFVLNRKNFRKVPSMVKLAKKLNVQVFFIEPVTTYTKKGKELKLKKREVEEFKEIAKKAYFLARNLETNLQQFFSPELIEKTGNMIEEIKKNIKDDKRNFLSVPCYEPWWRMGIRVDGWICPCGFLDQNTTENIRQKSLKEIWFGEYFKTRRKQLLYEEMPKYCERCCTTLLLSNHLIRDELSKLL
jgi:MoaA/NifB/PqqE/SkfB family radical SAM enzyme